MSASKIKRAVALFLALCALTGAVAGCARTVPPSPPPETSDDFSETLPEEKKPVLFPLFSDSVPLYTILADDYTVANTVEAINALQLCVKERTGSELPLNDGTMPRSISVSITGGEKTSWSIKVAENGNVAITGGCGDYVRRAINVFMTLVCTGKDPEPVVNAGWDLVYSGENGSFIDNSSLLSYTAPTAESLQKSSQSGMLFSPDWLDTAVMVELKVDIASIGGKFSDSYDLVDFYASVGVNCLWLCPVYARGKSGNGYTNLGPHTIEPSLTGTEDYAEGWQELRKFVDYAHSKGIYVLLDLITWGTVKGAPLHAEHPDWYYGEAWGGDAFNWRNRELVKWFTDVCVNNILVTDADGFRCDCEPVYAGYNVFEGIRNALAEKGKYVVLMSEDGNERTFAFDMEQDGVLDYSQMTRSDYYFTARANFFADGRLDIVKTTKDGIGIGSAESQKSSLRRGTAKYYTNCLTNHDFMYRTIKGDRIKIGYSAILAPYIPLWFMGDEFNCLSSDSTLYFLNVDYSKASTTAFRRLFLEDVKKYVQIRRTLSDIFEYFPENHRDSNIVAVNAEGLGDLTAYARYGGGKAVLIVPNSSGTDSCSGKVTIPFAECGLDTGDGKMYKVTDLMTGVVLFTGKASEIGEFYVSIPWRNMGIYLIEEE